MVTIIFANMKHIYHCLFAAALLSIPFYGNSQNLTDIESIEYDPQQGRFLVSNGSSVIHVNGNGDGVATLPSPTAAAYGMEVMNNQLYAIHANAVKVFDLNSGALLGSASITGANFLNGMASNGSNLVWVTDFGAKKIHQIDFTDVSNPTTSVLVNNTVSTPNGIVFDAANNRLVFVAWGSNAPIKAVDLSNNTVSTLFTTNLGNCDGIDIDGSGNFYVASWSPNRITKFNNDFSVNEIITVAGGLSSAADICYANENDTLAIPNSGNNTVVYVGFNNNPIFTEEETSFDFQLLTLPHQWEILFENYQPSPIAVQCFDMSGKLMISETLDLPVGRNRYVLPHAQWASGPYIIEMRQEQSVQSFKVHCQGE